MPQKPRKRRSAEEKVALLEKHHLEKEPISAIGEAADVQPSLFYYWQRQLFENAASALGEGASGASRRQHPPPTRHVDHRVATALLDVVGHRYRFINVTDNGRDRFPCGGAVDEVCALRSGGGANAEMAEVTAAGSGGNGSGRVEKP